MKIQTESLKDNGYELLATMDHNNLWPFVIKYLSKSTIISIIWKGSHIIAVIYNLALTYKLYFEFGQFFAFLLVNRYRKTRYSNKLHFTILII